MSGKGGEVHEGEGGRKWRGRVWSADETNVGLNEKKELSVGRKARERRRERLWVKRLGEGERKGVVKNRGTDEGPWVCPHLL